MKTAILIPDNVFRTAERFAKNQELSRSALFTLAVEEFIAHHRRKGVTEQLNRVYATEDSRLDPALETLQFASLPEDRW